MKASEVVYSVLEALENYYLRFLDDVCKELKVSKIQEAPHYSVWTDHIFFESLVKDLMKLRTAILSLEIEVKRTRGVISENYVEDPVIARGLVNLVLMRTVPPLTFLGPLTTEEYLKMLYGYARSFLMFIESEGIDVPFIDLPPKPEVLSEESILGMGYTEIDLGSYDDFFTVIEDPKVFKLGQEFLDKIHKDLLSYTSSKTRLLLLENFAKYFPELTISIPVLREYILLVRKNFHPRRFTEDPISLIWVFQLLWNAYADFNVVTHSNLTVEVAEEGEGLEESSEGENEGKKEPSAKSKKKKELPYRAIVFTNANCPICKAILSSRDFLELLGRLEHDKGVRAVFIEVPRLEAYTVFSACYVKIMPSILYKLIFVHGISPEVASDEGVGMNIRKIAQIILREESPFLVEYSVPQYDIQKLYPPEYNPVDGEFLFNEIIKEGAKEAIFQKILNA